MVKYALPIEAPKVEILIKDHNLFLEDLGFRESSGNYHAVNQFGYLGKYQFGSFYCWG